MKAEITTTVEVDGEIYIFRIQREDGEITITTTPGTNHKIKELIVSMLKEAERIL